MTPEARFERIETALQATADGLVQVQPLLKTVVELQLRTHQTIQDLGQYLGRYADAADARMKRIEVNLDGLIRSITAEHGNGKKQ